MHLPRPVIFHPRFLLVCLLTASLGVIVASPVRAANAPKLKAPVKKGGLPGYVVVQLGRGHNNRLKLAATIEGKKGLMMVDTGAHASLLSLSKYGGLLKEANRKLPPGVPKTVSMNGVPSAVVVTRDFVIQNQDLGPIAAALVPGRFIYDQAALYDREAGSSYDGLIGEDLLRRTRAVVDCSRLILYLNVDPAKQFHLGPELTRNGWTRVPMTSSGNHFLVPCTLKGHQYRLIVDTGAPLAILDRGIAHSAGASSHDLPLSGGLVGMQAERMALLDSHDIAIGNFQISSYLMARSGVARVFESLGRNGGPPILGLLGGDLLAKNGAIIDIGGSALYLKRTAPAKKS